MIVHRIIQLQPDMIILFAGINDLTRSVNNYDYLHYIQTGPLDRFRQLRYLATESQIVRRFYYLFNRPSENITQVFQEIRKNDQIIACDACQRILYDPENLDHPFETV